MILSLSMPPDLPAGTLDYYLICDEACYPNPFAAAQMEASSALMNITELQEAISGYITGNSLDIVRTCVYVCV